MPEAASALLAFVGMLRAVCPDVTGRAARTDARD